MGRRERDWEGEREGWRGERREDGKGRARVGEGRKGLGRRGWEGEEGVGEEKG